MRVVVQRVSKARVLVENEEIGGIGVGFVVLVGVSVRDSDADVETIVRKVSELRVFPDDQGRMNRSIEEAGGSVLVVSQFTLLADVRRGRRPSFSNAAGQPVAEPLVDAVCSGFRARGIATSTGSFGDHMEVDLVNDGPVTIVIDTVDGQVS